MGNRLALMSCGATDVRLGAIAHEIERLHGEWLVLMCCDATDVRLEPHSPPQERPSLRAPLNPGENFRCRPDWRLNLVLCAGNKASSSKVPVFEHMSADDFDKLVSKSMSHCLRAAGRLDKKPVQLPYVLYRFRADAPGPATESPDRRWSSALSPLLEDASLEGRLAYKSGYDWTMRERLDLL
eukprot:s3249_g2.t1